MKTIDVFIMELELLKQKIDAMLTLLKTFEKSAPDVKNLMQQWSDEVWSDEDKESEETFDLDEIAETIEHEMMRELFNSKGGEYAAMKKDGASDNEIAIQFMIEYDIFIKKNELSEEDKPLQQFIKFKKNSIDGKKK